MSMYIIISPAVIKVSEKYNNPVINVNFVKLFRFMVLMFWTEFYCAGFSNIMYYFMDVIFSIFSCKIGRKNNLVRQNNNLDTTK